MSPVDLDKLMSPQGGFLLHQDVLDALRCLPDSAAQLIIADPPYNMNKDFHGVYFGARSSSDYQAWVEPWLQELCRILSPDGSAYICGDWRSSAALALAAEKLFSVRSRITWEREKGRAAKANWKNTSEDIWFLTKGANYFFDAEAVKIRRTVLAPYTKDGLAKDWKENLGQRYRDTSCGNLWTDLTVPFWSMPENTPHPTQKPEKLMARLMLASSRPNDLVLDPFCGSGTVPCVARKLGRRYIGIDINPMYLSYAWERLDRAGEDTAIQGFEDGVFYDRNYRKKR